MGTSEAKRQTTLKKHFSSYKGNSRTGKQYDSSSSSSSSSSSTPHIKEVSEEVRKENEKIQSTQDRRNNEAKNQAAKIAIAAREAEKLKEKKEAEAAKSNAKKNYVTPTTPTPINPNYQANNNISSLQSLVVSQNTKGNEATTNYEMSSLSKGFYNKAHNVAETIRTGAETDEFKSLPGSTLLGYTTRSTANLIDMAGMIPGGLETMADNPGVIVPALTVGAYQSTVGTAQAFKEDPLQTTSDIATGALLMGGIAKVAPKAIGAGGAGIKAVAPKGAALIEGAGSRAGNVAGTLIKPVSDPLIASGKLMLDARAIKSAKAKGGELLFDAEMVRLQGTGKAKAGLNKNLEPYKVGIEDIGADISQGLKGGKAEANNLLFDAEMVRLQGKQGINKIGSGILEGTKQATEKVAGKIPTDQVKTPINNLLFDAEMVRLRGNQGIKAGLEGYKKGMESIGSDFSTGAKGAKAEANNLLFDAEMVRLQGKQGIYKIGSGIAEGTKKASNNKFIEPYKSGLESIGSDFLTGAKGAKAEANNLLFDAEMVRLQGKAGFKAVGSGIAEGAKNVKMQAGADLKPIKTGVDNLLFDAEMAKLRGKQNLKNGFNDFLMDEMAQLNPQIEPQLRPQARPSIKPVGNSITGPKFNSANLSFLAPGFAMGSMQGSKQGNRQISGPAFKMDMGLDFNVDFTQDIGPMQIQGQAQGQRQRQRQKPRQEQALKLSLMEEMPGLKPIETFNLPKGKQKDKDPFIMDPSKWGSRTKKHYVADPRKLL